MKRLTWLVPVLGFALASGCGSDGNKAGDDGGARDSGHTDGGAVCGNHVVEGAEECDDGNSTGNDGCENDCTYTCSVDADCDDGVVCNGTETCSTSMHVCQAGTQAADGTNCDYAVVSGPSGDGGVSDGGTSQMILGRCVAGECGKPCTTDDQCDDDDPCNGVETCNTTYNSCEPGTPLDCDDGERCTADSCDPMAPGYCVNELTNDGDGDGYVAEGITCDDTDLEGDCDDGDGDTHPGAQELCDGKDNDCDGAIETSAQMPTWYEDCDGDGFAPPPADQIQEPVVSCTKPATTPQCIDWTTTTPSGSQNQDCDDTVGEANPGVAGDAWFALPYCEGEGKIATTYTGSSCTGGTAVASFDYNCSGSEERDITSTVRNATTCERYCAQCGDFCLPGSCSGGCTSCLYYGCRTTGWTGSSLPACGQTAQWRTCKCGCGIGPLICRSCDSCSDSTSNRQVQCH